MLCVHMPIFLSLSATVTHSVIQQDDMLLTYTPASSWGSYNFDTWDIPHPSLNTTFNAVGIGNISGSVTIPFTGKYKHYLTNIIIDLRLSYYRKRCLHVWDCMVQPFIGIPSLTR